jgi:hypothetical protein
MVGAQDMARGKAVLDCRVHLVRLPRLAARSPARERRHLPWAHVRRNLDVARLRHVARLEERVVE